MAAKSKHAESAAAQVGKTAFQEWLIDLPTVGWLFVLFFSWWDHRREKR
jgi:hypothetical protein